LLCFYPEIWQRQVSSQAVPCVFLGYPFGQKAYKVLNLETHRVFTSRDVVFHEETLPYKSISAADNSTIFPNFSSHEYHEHEPFSNTNREQPQDISTNSPLASHLSSPINHNSQHSSNCQPARRSHKAPTYLSDYVCINVLTNNHTFQHSYWPNSVTSLCCNVTAVHSLSIQSHTLLQHLESHQGPTSYEEASTGPEWQEAMAKEFEALQDNNTWELVPLPAGKRPISCKWVYKIKYKADGGVERCKARLVIRGFT